MVIKLRLNGLADSQLKAPQFLRFLSNFFTFGGNQIDLCQQYRQYRLSKPCSFEKY